MLRSTRVRILGWVLIPVLLVLLISWVAAWGLLQQRLNERIDTELQGEANELRLLADEGVDPSTGEPFTDVAALLDLHIQRSIADPNETMFVVVDGQVRTRSADDPPVRLDLDRELVADVAAATEVSFGNADTAAGDVRYAAVPVQAAGQTGVYVVAIFADLEGQDLAQVMSRFAAIALVAFAAAAGVAWFVAGRLLAPLRHMRATAQAISDSDLSQRIPVDQRGGGDEIAQLGRTFNEMLDRLGAAFAAQRAFVDDAGHELRTPLTIVQGHLQLLEDDPVQRRQTLDLVLDELGRMSRIVHDLQTLTKASQPGFLHLESVDVPALLDEILVKASALGERRWTLAEHHVPHHVMLDRHRISQAMLQLASNAYRYTRPTDRIAFFAGVDGGTLRLGVADAGPGIAPEERTAVLERFRRGSADSSDDGAGLGLALVAAIAEAHGGTVEIGTSGFGGAVVTLLLPLRTGVPPRRSVETKEVVP